MTQIDLTSYQSSALALHAPGQVAKERDDRAVVGDWRLVHLAAEGSFARVYRARPTNLPDDRPADYAVKMLQSGLQSERWAVSQLAREARVGRTVSHPHLIPILDAGVSGESRYTVMPWLEGRTLAAQLGTGELPEVPVALWIARQAADALGALHRAAWMHGDVKPGNIFVSPLGHVTLLDLGFARRPDETGSAADRRISGTCSHMAPEFLTSAIGADIRSDIYSLGVVLFEMLTGRLPFTGSSMAELATHHRQSTPPPLRTLAPHVPDDVARLVHRMLAKEPLRRPQTPDELVKRLTTLEVATFSQRAV